MSQLFDLIGFAAQMRVVDRDLKETESAIVARAAEMIAKKARGMIGKPHEGWPPLAASTLEKKAANTPLLETGELRDSIQFVVSGNEACVGSDSPIAVYQE